MDTFECKLRDSESDHKKLVQFEQIFGEASTELGRQPPTSRAARPQAASSMIINVCAVDVSP